MRGPELYGREPQNPRFTPNGEYLYFNWLPPGTDWRETTKPYRVRAQAGARPERVTQAHMDSVGPSLAPGELSRDGARRAVSYNGDLYLVDVRARHDAPPHRHPGHHREQPLVRRCRSTALFPARRPERHVARPRHAAHPPGHRHPSRVPHQQIRAPRRNSAPRSRTQQKQLFGVIRDQVRYATPSIAPIACGAKARVRRRCTSARTSASPGSRSRQPETRSSSRRP